MDDLIKLYEKEDNLSIDRIYQLGSGLLIEQELRDGNNRVKQVVIGKDMFETIVKFLLNQYK